MLEISQPPENSAHTTTLSHSTLVVWVTLVLGLLISVIAWSTAVRYEEQVTATRFNADVRERQLRIREEFENASSKLEGLAAMYAANSGVTDQQFLRVVKPILVRNPAVTALSWNPVITHVGRQAHESGMHISGMTGYRVTQRSNQGDIETATRRDLYVVVSAIQQVEGKNPAVGFDVRSENMWRMALDQARDTAAITAAVPGELVQKGQKSQFALAFMPVYEGATVPATVEERRSKLDGYYGLVVDSSKIVAAALSNYDNAGIELNIVFPDINAAPTELYVSNRFTAVNDKAAPSGIFTMAPLTRAMKFIWAGRELKIQFVASGAYQAAGKSWIPLTVLMCSLMLTLLIAAMTRLLQSRTAQVAWRVVDRTRELEDANRVLEIEIERRNEIEERLEAYQHDLERKVEERTSELKASTNQLRAILESEPECVKIVTADGKLEDMNAAGLEMIEAESIESVRGADVYALVDEDYREAFVDLNRRVIAGESDTLQFKLVGLKKSERWVETNAVPLSDPDGGPNRHLAITRDITEKKALEQARARMEGQLRHKQKLESIGVMAGGIAHDFNNLLQVIIGNSEIALDDGTIKGRTRRSLEAGQGAAIDAAKICDQMLTYAGKSQRLVRPIELHLLVESIANLLEVSRSKTAEFELVLKGVTNKIDGDDAQLRQVVLNLVTNASEAIGEQPGSITLTISTVDTRKDLADHDWVGFAPPEGRYVSLDISDSGCGMNDETKERMFDPFFSTKFSGRGLGLSTTLGIIQSHSGFLKVVSQRGQGTEITVLFPVSKSVELPAPLEREKLDAIDATVLLVDDDTAVRQVGHMILSQLGCRVVQAAHGQEAVEYLAAQGECIDVVLLDLAMPRMSGQETGIKLRQIRPDIAIVYCSGYAADAVHEDAGTKGFTGFLHKPYRRQQLVNTLHDALNFTVEA